MFGNSTITVRDNTKVIHNIFCAKKFITFPMHFLRIAKERKKYYRMLNGALIPRLCYVCLRRGFDVQKELLYDFQHVHSK